jgi:hypothetical protein
LHTLQRARTDDVEDREGGEVEETRALAHREVLRIDERRPPAAFPFRGAARHPVAELLQQRRVGLVPLRAFPAGGLEERRAELALAFVKRSKPDVAVGGPLLARVDDAVGLVEALGGTRAHVRACRLVFVKASDVRGVKVDLRLPMHHPFSERLARARALLDPHRGRRPQPFHVRRLAQYGHAVRGERQDAIDRVFHPD